MNRLLVLYGTVVHGEGFGKQIGFPTVNIDRRSYKARKLNLRLGIYSGNVKLANSKIYKAGIVIGPIDKFNLPKLEAHLIGFNGNLYGQKVTFELHKYLRPFKKYKSQEELISAIAKDIENIKSI